MERSDPAGVEKKENGRMGEESMKGEWGWEGHIIG